MGKIRIFILFALLVSCVLISFSDASAAPMYYTFEGRVTSIFDGGGLLALNGVTIGATNEIVFLIDFDGQGSVTHSNNINNPLPVSGFYADWISGSLMFPNNEGHALPVSSLFVYEYNYGQTNAPNNFNAKSLIYGGSEFDLAQVFNSSTDWNIGQAIFFRELGYNDNRVLSYYTSALTLVSISDSLPASSVPEPATMLLFGAGLAGLAIFRHHRKIS